MKYFNKKGRLLILDGVKKYAKKAHNAEVVDSEPYIKAYMNFIKKTDSDVLMMHFDNNFYDEMVLLHKYKVDKNDVYAWVYGKLCYLVGRALNEGISCNMSKYGSIIIEDKLVTALSEFHFISEKDKIFEEDEQELPSIDEYYNSWI